MFCDLQLIAPCDIATRNEIYQNLRELWSFLRILDISKRILELLFVKFQKEF